MLYYLYYYNGGGVATGDINNDGLPDIYFTANSNGNNKLYLNKGDFKFEDITDKAGVTGTADWCSGVTMADVNGDGFLDIYVCAVSNAYGLKGRNQLYINNGITPSQKGEGTVRLLLQKVQQNMVWTFQAIPLRLHFLTMIMTGIWIAFFLMNHLHLIKK
ncbi:MAG: VCBS repeat-containing protein [Segetibacter sp.]